MGPVLLPGVEEIGFGTGCGIFLLITFSLDVSRPVRVSIIANS
jgi:hypothetical protein